MEVENADVATLERILYQTLFDVCVSLDYAGDLCDELANVEDADDGQHDMKVYHVIHEDIYKLREDLLRIMRAYRHVCGQTYQ